MAVFASPKNSNWSWPDYLLDCSGLGTEVFRRNLPGTGPPWSRPANIRTKIYHNSNPREKPVIDVIRIKICDNFVSLFKTWLKSDDPNVIEPQTWSGCDNVLSSLVLPKPHRFFICFSAALKTSSWPSPREVRFRGKLQKYHLLSLFDNPFPDENSVWQWRRNRCRFCFATNSWTNNQGNLCAR